MRVSVNDQDKILQKAKNIVLKISDDKTSWILVASLTLEYFPNFIVIALKYKNKKMQY
jgi:hypothetical protein